MIVENYGDVRLGYAATLMYNHIYPVGYTLVFSAPSTVDQENTIEWHAKVVMREQGRPVFVIESTEISFEAKTPTSVLTTLLNSIPDAKIENAKRDGAGFFGMYDKDVLENLERLPGMREVMNTHGMTQLGNKIGQRRKVQGQSIKNVSIRIKNSNKKRTTRGIKKGRVLEPGCLTESDLWILCEVCLKHGRNDFEIEMEPNEPPE